MFEFINVFKEHKEDISTINKGKIFGISIVGVIVSLGAYLLLKIAMPRIPILYSIQFTVQMATLTFGISLFFLLYSIEDKLQEISKKKFYLIIREISKSTLEIYLVNMLCINRANKLVFPLSLLTAIISIFAVGILLHRIIELFGHINRGGKS